MRPIADTHGWMTNDLTQCTVHALKNSDGSTSILLRYPATWKPAGEPVPVLVGSPPCTDEECEIEGPHGHSKMQFYHVLTWNDVVLKTG